uniref:Uncharacterized protein n=1 Tax=Setaria italica TaxID=4555 RepID=K3ZG94_SETIT
MHSIEFLCLFILSCLYILSLNRGASFIPCMYMR